MRYGITDVSKPSRNRRYSITDVSNHPETGGTDVSKPFTDMMY